MMMARRYLRTTPDGFQPVRAKDLGNPVAGLIQIV
jgi:hypothetical protein